MILKAILYNRFSGKNNEWSIEGASTTTEHWITFGNINLIVGKNASGKSRTITAIRYIADLIAGEIKLSTLQQLGFGTASYRLKFEDDGNCIEYFLSFEEGKIMQETLSINNELKLNRQNEQLWYEGVNKMLDFQTDDNILAISKRDKKQHSFFEKLYYWGKNLNHYRFGEKLGKNNFLKDINIIDQHDYIDLKNGDKVAEAFLIGNKHFKNFTSIIINDMKSIDYSIMKIEALPLKSIANGVYGLVVYESDLENPTDQLEMSQGMFRALSLIIQLNYSLLSKTPSCILIDDIGEGLDFERSKSLIDLIIQKIKNSSVQVIMTTNDRFVMNKIPLEYWSVIQRGPKKSVFYNFDNSRQTFEEYKYSGLSNFDFLATEFYISGFDKKDDDDK